MGIHRNVKQGAYGEGFVYALACAAGLTVGRQNLDVDGVDWLVSYPGARGIARSPKMELQVKSWASPAGDDTTWRFPMPVGHFNHLAGDGFQLPRYLVLVVVPTAPEDWTITSVDGTVLSHAAYWASFRHEAPIIDDSSRRKITVAVPKENILTVDTLYWLLDGVPEQLVAS